MKLIPIAAAALVAAAIAAGSAATPSTLERRNGPLVFDAVKGGELTGTLQLYRISPTGRGRRQLTGTSPLQQTWNECPSWSSSGRAIYFDSAARGPSGSGPSGIYRINADGSGRAAVEQSSKASHLCPSVNRRSTRIAAIEYTGNNRNFIITMNRHGDDLRVVARASRYQDNYGPEYAPRGSRLAFYRVTYVKRGAGILRSDILVRSGKRNHVITRRSKQKFAAPSWAPDARTLIAVRGQKTIVRMNPDGSQIRVVATIRRGHIESVVFSPDGRKIAFMRCIGDCGDPFLAGRGSIWVMNANGSGRHAIFSRALGGQPAGTVDWAPKR